MENQFIRVEAMLLVFGMTHTGFKHMYLPMDIGERGRICLLADSALHFTEKMEERQQYASLEDVTGEWSMEEIGKGRMREPAPEKFAYYENYYLNTKKLSHPVVVDSDKNIVSGYVSYLLAKERGIPVRIYRTKQQLPVQKIVTCRLAVKGKRGFRKEAKGEKKWIYGLEAAVMPGEVLWIRTAEKEQYLWVDSLEFVTGKPLLKEDWD